MTKTIKIATFSLIAILAITFNFLTPAFAQRTAPTNRQIQSEIPLELRSPVKTETRIAIEATASVVNPLAAVNGASFKGAPNGDDIISIFNANGGFPELETAWAEKFPLPNILANCIVAINGQVLNLFYVSSTQINALSPAGLPKGQVVNMVVQYDYKRQDGKWDTKTITSSVQIGWRSFGIFRHYSLWDYPKGSPEGTGMKEIAAAKLQIQGPGRPKDGDWLEVAYPATQNGKQVMKLQPIQMSDFDKDQIYLVLFGTGFAKTAYGGPAYPEEIEFRIENVGYGKALWVGPHPQFAGEVQVNIRINEQARAYLKAHAGQAVKCSVRISDTQIPDNQREEEFYLLPR